MGYFFSRNVAIKDLLQQSPLSMVALYGVSASCDQALSENIKWKISEVNNSHILNCVPS